MDIKLIETTKSLGFQTNEARIYLAILELGKATVTEISKAAGLNRTTGYDILERLCVHGVVNRSTLGKKNMYIAEPPSRLRQYLAKKKKIIENSQDELGNIILPTLQSLYKTESKPGIKFFEGREGIKNIYNHVLDAKSTIYSILDAEQYLPEFDQFGKDHAKDRTRSKVKEKALVKKSRQAQKFWDETYRNKPHKQKITEYRWLEDTFSFSPAAEVMIYDDKVIGVLFKPGENVAFEVTSQSFADSLKILFNLIWMQSKSFE